MNPREEFFESEEVRKNRIWKAMSGYQRHMTLMYFYRILTDHEHISDYVETHRFQKLEIDPCDLPDFVFYLRPDQLKEMAMEQPYSPVFVPEVKVYPEYKKKPEYRTTDYSGFLESKNGDPA